MSLGRLIIGITGACLALLLLVQPGWAEGSGVIKGKVMDRATKEGLPGANVVVKGTSLGASTDLSGEFIIRNVPAGDQTLVVSYVGYKSLTASARVPEDATLTQDFSLTATTVEGEEIVVTAQAQGQLQAINQQLTSDKIVSVVSEAKIQELPDFNAAQAISRLPGVSTLQSSGEANKVVIRGLAPQYNEVALSGITLAATGGTQIGAASQGFTAGVINNDRSVDLTMITPYMIKTMEVYKSLTPDFEANAIGGFVNMELREAPGGFKSDLLAQGGYTAKSGKYNNYRFVGAASDRFFDDLFGVYVLANAESYDRNSDNMTAGYDIKDSRAQANGWRPVAVNNVTLDRHLETRERFGGNLIMDYRLPEGSIKSINVLSRLNSDGQDFSTILDYVNHFINSRYRSGVTKTDLAVNTLQVENDFGFMSAQVTASNSYSRSYVPESPQFDFSQTNGIPGLVPWNTIPEQLFSGVHYLGAGKMYLTNISLFSSSYKEDDEVLKGDLKFPFDLRDITSGALRVGGVWRYNYHSNEQGTPYAGIRPGSPISQQIVNILHQNYGWTLDSAAGYFPGTNFTTADPKIMETFLDNSFGSMLWACDPNALKGAAELLALSPNINAINSTGSNAGGWFDGPFQRLPNNYKYIERYYAAYMMSTLNFGEDISVVGGVRWEENLGYFDAFNLGDGRDATHQAVDPVSAHPHNRFLLPMVQGKWNFLPWADIRYSYTQTLARPDYHQLSPHFNMDYTQFNVYAGNPRLVPAHAYNHDVFLTLHSNELGLLSIGGFYKEVDDFTYYTTYKLHPTATAPGLDTIGTYAVHAGNGTLIYPKDGAVLNTYINSPYAAFLRGIEVDFQTRLWYLPAPFDGIVLGANYTHIHSSAQYPWFNDTTIVVPPRSTKVITLSRVRSGRLINQPNDVVNAYVGYDYEGFSGRLSFLFQGNSVNSIGGLEEQDGFTKDFFRIDASIRQKLPVDGLSLFLDANNLNSRRNEATQPSFGGFTLEQNYGLVASIGVRYTM